MKTILITISLLFPFKLLAQVNVGISAPLTGICAEYGAAVQKGLQLAVEEEKESQGKINFIFEDNQYDGTQSVSVFNKLVNSDKVQAIYSWGEVSLNAVSDLAEKNKTPLLSMSNDDMPARNKNYIINMQLPPEDYAAMLLNEIHKKGDHSFALIVSQDSYTEAMARGLRNTIKSNDKIEITLDVLPDASDFRSEITKLKSKKFDAVIAYVLPGQAGLFAKQLRQAGIASNLYGSDPFESEEEFKLSGGALSGAVFTNYAVPLEFLSKMKEKFPEERKLGFAWNSYLFTKATFRVFDKPFPASPEDIILSYKYIFLKESFAPRTSAFNMQYLNLPILIRGVSPQGEFFEIG
jgi:ABC-type branched-subunit amino acid transport system substrate-binding protein